MLRERPSDARDAVLRLLPNGSAGAEVGVYQGDLSARILQQVQPTALQLIDPWNYESDELYLRALFGGDAGGTQAQMDDLFQSVADRFASQIAAGQVILHRAPSSLAANDIADATLDWSISTATTSMTSSKTISRSIREKSSPTDSSPATTTAYQVGGTTA